MLRSSLGDPGPHLDLRTTDLGVGKSEIRIPARAGSVSLLSGLWSPSQKGQEVAFLLCPSYGGKEEMEGNPASSLISILLSSLLG